MSVGIKCDACGYINPVGRLYYAKCGEKLNVSRIVTDLATRKKIQLRIVRSAILVLVLAALVQLLRPAPLEGAPGTLDDANRLVARMNRLYDGAQNRRAVQEIVTEAELNAYLAGLMSAPREEVTEPLLGETLKSFRIRLSPERVSMVWVTKAGALPVTFTVTGSPKTGDGAFRFDVISVRAGRLPLPGPIGAWAATRLFRTFEKLESERNLLNTLSVLEVGERKAMVAVGRRP